MQREIFDDEHDAFRDLCRTFIAKEVTPHHEQWEEDGQVDRAVWTAAGAAGLLGTAVPEEYGGGGVPDFRFNLILGEELAYAGTGGAGLGLTLHNDICLPYFLSLCTEEQKQRWLPGICSGELITAIAMTEPGIGSDLQGDDHHGDPRRRPLRRQRLQDVHHQRHQRRPRDHRGQDRPDPEAQGHEPGGAGARAWTASNGAATWRRSASTARTPPSST
jgi:hypothetical protein